MEPCKVLGEASILTDRELLTAFAKTRDEQAFRTLVLRHQALVWGICQRMLPGHQDREDAFQATFLKLVMNADKNHWHETIGGWLYKVAYRMSLKMRAAQRKKLEVEILEEPWADNADLEEIQRHDSELALHAAIGELPRRYRDPIVLCYFHNKSQLEAAAEIGCSLDALNGRLRRGRRNLFYRLGRCGAGFTFSLVAAKQTFAAAQPELATNLADQAVLWGMNHLAGKGTVPPGVKELCQGEVTAMFYSGMVSQTLLTVGCGALFFLGSGGLLSGIYSTTPASAAFLSTTQTAKPPAAAAQEELPSSLAEVVPRAAATVQEPPQKQQAPEVTRKEVQEMLRRWDEERKNWQALEARLHELHMETYAEPSGVPHAWATTGLDDLPTGEAALVQDSYGFEERSKQKSRKVVLQELLKKVEGIEFELRKLLQEEGAE